MDRSNDFDTRLRNRAVQESLDAIEEEKAQKEIQEQEAAAQEPLHQLLHHLKRLTKQKNLLML